MDDGGIGFCNPDVVSVMNGDDWEAAHLTKGCEDGLIHHHPDALQTTVPGLLWDFDSCDLDDLEGTSHPSSSVVDLKAADPRPSISKEKNRL